MVQNISVYLQLYEKDVTGDEIVVPKPRHLDFLRQIKKTNGDLPLCLLLDLAPAPGRVNSVAEKRAPVACLDYTRAGVSQTNWQFPSPT